MFTNAISSTLSFWSFLKLLFPNQLKFISESKSWCCVLSKDLYIVHFFKLSDLSNKIDFLFSGPVLLKFVIFITVASE